MATPESDVSNESHETGKVKKGKKSKGQVAADTDDITDKITRPAIKSAETVDLWVMAGGRCEFCNKYLLHDEVFSVDLNLAEKAHIVGWNDAPGSPRGQDPLPLDARNDAPNLMLLCADHHRIIDSSKYRGDFTVDRLRKRKAKHEARIKFLTGLTEDQETVVLRMLGPIRDTKVEVSRQHAAAVVLKKERYPRFPLSLEGQDLEIDTAKFPDPERAWEEHWTIGKVMIDGQISKVHEGLASGQIRHLSVFALSRIPLLIYLGYKIGDKIPTDIYQKQRGPEESWLWSEEAVPIEFESNQIQSSSTSENVALLLSLSGSLSVSQLPSNIDSTFNIFEIKPIGVTPNRDLLENYQSLVNFTKVYHQFLSALEVTNKSAKQIHLFSAIPISAAVACGRGIMRDAQPSLLVYDRYQETYKLAFKIN